MNTTPHVVTRGSDNNRNLLCARDVFPNGPRHGPALLFSSSRHIRQCHTLYSTMLLSKVLCTIRHRRTRGTFQHRTTKKRPPASRVAGSHSCSYTLGTRPTMTTSGGLCCKTSASDS